jgi:hypothetical protein
MELPTEAEPLGDILISPGMPESLVKALIEAHAHPGRIVTVRRGKMEGVPMEIYDTDGEGSVLWNPADAESEEGAHYTDLFLRVVDDGETLKIRRPA